MPFTAGLVAGIELAPHGSEIGAYDVFVDCFNRGISHPRDRRQQSAFASLIVEAGQIDDLVGLLSEAIDRVP